MRPSKSPLFTIFTPTYNRAHTLPRLYASIRSQTVRDFEWLIVDDGSTDGTKGLIAEWQKEENDFPIRYIWQPNQHKKVAFNRGVREARGQWFVPIDSDDELLPDTLEKFIRMWESIPPQDIDRYAAVVGLYVDGAGKAVVDTFPNEPLDASAIELYFDYKIRGDKFSCLVTEILRSYPFPEDIPGHLPESVVWFRIAEHYTQRCFNVPVGVCHTDVESITRPKDRLLSIRRNAEGAMLRATVTLDYVNWRRFIRTPMTAIYFAALYNRWALYLPRKRRRYRPKLLGSRLLTRLMWSIGLFLYIRDHMLGYLERYRQ